MASGRVNSSHRSAVLALAIAALAAPVASAQTDAKLVAVVRLAQDGFADSARAVMKRLLDGAQPADSSYAELLYTAGLVAATDAERRTALRRVIVEYSQSAWADDALLLLGQTEYANGNPAATVTQIDKLLNDYPTSPLLAVGALWGARAASDLGNAAVACRMATAGIAAPNDDVEIKNQLEYQKQRCSALALARPADTAPSPKPPPGDSAPATKSAERATGKAGDKPATKSAAKQPDKTTEKPAETAAAKPAAAKPARTGPFSVQIIAAPSEARAEQEVSTLKAAGFDGFVVHEGPFFKVRAGPYATKAEAQQALAKVRAKLKGQPFIVVAK
jgi:cell division septation protein DedD